MDDVHLTVTTGDTTLPATLSVPISGPIRGGIVPLHPASDPSRDQFLFRHLADLLTPQGVGVLRFDRRPSPDDHDIPLAIQAGDALAALRTLRNHPRIATRSGGDGRDLPVGLWGFSQGAWAAPLAASLSDEVTFLALVASTGVSPARQMRYGTAQQLLRAGFGQDALEELAHLRAAYEEYLRGRTARETTQVLIDRLSERAWFPLGYVPRELPQPGAWRDMDFDPLPIFSRVRCPVLLFYGEDDEWTPVDESIDAWRRAASLAGNAEITVVRLPGTSHHPTLHDGREIAAISPLYAQRLQAWVLARLEQPS